MKRRIAMVMARISRKYYVGIPWMYCICDDIDDEVESESKFGGSGGLNKIAT